MAPPTTAATTAPANPAALSSAAATANSTDPSRAYSPAPGSLLSVPNTPSQIHNHKVQNTTGYQDVVFAGKKAQAARVEEVVRQKAFIPTELVHNEVAWFFNSLGIDDTYFRTESVETIASHIISLYGSKVLAYSQNEGKLRINLKKESESGAIYIVTSDPGVSDKINPNCEQRIDEKFLDKSTVQKAYRLETYRSSGNVSSTLSQQLRCYFVSLCEFVDPSPAEGESDIKKVSDKQFLDKVSPNTLQIYQDVMKVTLERTGPVIECFEVEGSKERRLVIGYKTGTSKRFFSALSDLYHWYGIYSTRKYVEQFSNGVTIISLYLNPLHGPPIESSVFQIMREASLLFCLPDNPFFDATPDTHAVQEATYAYAAWVFAQHFLNRLGQSYANLKTYLDESDPAQASALLEIRTQLRDETFTREGIKAVLKSYPEIVRLCYVNFAMVHYVSGANQLMPTLSYQRIHTSQVLSDQELFQKIKRTAANSHDRQVLESLLIFNTHILKTNMYTPTKVALSFRLNPSFLPEVEYPTRPYGIFLVVGSEFRGFHVRFKDVARGGIRIIRSRDRETYSINQRNLFAENYGLASTQASKNKDIPEGGSKGAILPDLNADPRTAFYKYVDAILDLCIPGNSPGIKERIVDLAKKEEILFFGPDEGTADMMDWAALHARSRNYPAWKSFTTGKSAETLGGIPHDLFGMTSLSVRQYVVGIYRKLGLREEDITKVQTGGPDGDLGSNEILLSKDKTVTIIDGSGVIHDPNGLNRTELVRLAKERTTISNFDMSKIGPDGYRVLVEDQDVTLPSGETVSSGFEFRNSAHFRYKADLFVPCGGRPESVNISNVSKLWDSEGKTNFKYIVEGANLFFTQRARLSLEKQGVILFKDASANKGGVTSSSLEVLVGLGLTDAEYIDLMTSNESDNDDFTDFYLDYVKEIQKIITQNAAAEFNAIWKEKAKSKKPFSILTDEIGQSLIKMQSELEGSDLYDNEKNRLAVLGKAIPKTLVTKVGLEEVCKRLPENYSRSLFASFVASKYVYQYGVSASPFDFLKFYNGLTTTTLN